MQIVLPAKAIRPPFSYVRGVLLLSTIKWSLSLFPKIFGLLGLNAHTRPVHYGQTVSPVSSICVLRLKLDICTSRYYECSFASDVCRRRYLCRYGWHGFARFVSTGSPCTVKNSVLGLMFSDKALYLICNGMQWMWSSQTTSDISSVTLYVRRESVKYFP